MQQKLEYHQKLKMLYLLLYVRVYTIIVRTFHKFYFSLIEARVKREAETKEKKTQDPYSIRCTPQVHGIVHETIAFVKSVLNTEINSATDNPVG